MASHLASHWKWDFLELGNGLLIWHDLQTVILVPGFLTIMFKFCSEANTLFSLFALLILYWLYNPTLTPFKVKFKTGNRCHQVNDSKVPYNANKPLL